MFPLSQSAISHLRFFFILVLVLQKRAQDRVERDAGLWMQDLWPLNFLTQFSGAVLERHCLSPFTLQRDNDPSLAPSTLEFDSLVHQAREQATAKATQGTVFLNQFSMVTVILS